MFKEILVIDDNPDIRFLICNILEEQKFKSLKVIWKIKVEIKGVRKPACVAKMITIVYE